MTLVPVTFILFVLIALRENDLYPRLPPAANYAIAAVYIGCALCVAYYMHTEYYELGTVARRRLGPDRPVRGRADDAAGAWNIRASATCRCSCSTSC